MNLYRCFVIGFALLSLWPLPVSAQKDTGMELILLGTGYPYPFPDRAGSSYAVVIGDRIFIVDAGRGAGMRLAAMDTPWKSIEAVFITHLHSDHIDGLPDLFHSTWQFGVDRPFELYGPKGIREVADGMLLFYQADIHIRRDLTEKLPSAGTEIRTHEVTEGVIYSLPDKGIRVTAFNVNHSPVEPAFGYRFDYGDYSIVFSGDTAPDPNLVRFAKGADILVHEAYVSSSAPSDGALHSWSIRDYHTSAKQAGEIATEAKAGVLVLTHLIPGNAPEELFRDEARKTFDGRIVVGRDLLRIRVPDIFKSESEQ